MKCLSERLLKRKVAFICLETGRRRVVCGIWVYWAMPETLLGQESRWLIKATWTRGVRCSREHMLAMRSLGDEIHTTSCEEDENTIAVQKSFKSTSMPTSYS